MQMRKIYSRQLWKSKQMIRLWYYRLQVIQGFSHPSYTATFSTTSAIDLNSGQIVGCIVKLKTDINVTSNIQMVVVATYTLLNSLINLLSNDTEQDPTSSIRSDEAGNLSTEYVTTKCCNW